MRCLENFVRLCAHLRIGNVVDGHPRVDRVLLSAFRLLHLRYLVNPIPAGRLKPLFFYVLFLVSFCLSTADLFACLSCPGYRIGESFFIAAMLEAIRRREGLHKTADGSAENCPLPAENRVYHQ